ncbi:putative bifunctional diguanylate cyclase/phosphodiesterase [Sphingomonas profundi]|uniref:putative bifunctional diguanylate cyclase/phosphodiesterase n=1 Tax=Alterirhizorhabdus profundi TaxID=2681549 RepID=UPI0012E7B4E9|nr:EAL domain-containing protein [Sphingomonas profundi]
MFQALGGALRRHLPMQYVLPIILLLGSSFGCLLALLIHTTIVQDRMERVRELDLVRNAFAGSAELMMHDLQDYARWDDAVRHLVQRLDAGWADDNISIYLGTVQGYSHVLVLDESGRVIYAFEGSRRGRPGFDATRLLGGGFVAAVQRLRAIGPSRDPIVSGYTRSGRTIYAFSAASIIPLTDKVTLPAGPTRTLVVARRLDQAMLDTLAQGDHSPRLSLVERPGAGVSLALAGFDGSHLGWITWQAVAPGTELRHNVLPGFAVVALIALAAAAVILLRARRGLEALRQSEANALRAAIHDPLTALGNRRAMVERLEAITGPAVLLYMDLDGFKETNDVYGHAAGDALLVEAARRIAAAAPEADLVARSGGDEFAVVLATPGPDGLTDVTEAIRAAFSTPFAIGGYSVSAGISVGSAETDGGCAAAELIRRADVAMYAAKASGKNCWCAYDPAMDEEHHERRRLESDLRVAIERGQIGVEFQPIVDAAGDVVCVEALARWSHPRHGAISPDIFVRVAERSGLINGLGRSVLTTACRAALHWGVDLAVNLSPAQFWDRTLVARIAAVLAETGYPAGRLELEITESYLLRRPDAAELILRQLRDLGIGIALDDFGTGFASIGYLRRLSFDRIKIDRSFVTHVAEDARSADMARAIVALAEALDLSVTAEGIETEAQAAIMRVIGCTRLQGWLFGRPMPARTMADWLEEARQVGIRG